MPLEGKMKVGDLVKWIGFPGASIPPSKTGPTSVGIIVKITKDLWCDNTRVDVQWGDGSFGNRLYIETIEVLQNEL